MKQLMIFALAVALLAGCRERAEEGEHHESKQPDAQADHEENILTIAPEMLRDLRITTKVVEERPGGEGVTVVGELKADQNRYAEVGVPVTARVVRLVATPGQNVRPGQLLAEMQSVELGRARADYHAAAARMTLARSNLNRKVSLGAGRIVPRREIEEAQAQVAAAEAELRAAGAALQALGASAASGRDASRFPLVSPIGGTVIERGVVHGQMVDPHDVAFRIGDLSNLWLIANASERDAVRVTPGSTARLTLAAFPGQVFTGRVTYVGGQVDPASRSIPVRVEVANPNHIFRPGMSANAWLPVAGAARQILTVPIASVQRIREQWGVFIPRTNRTFEIRPVGRGRDLEGEVEILTGLKSGETVVVNGAFLLKTEAEKAEGGGDHHGH